jgi:hypothetical protein
LSNFSKLKIQASNKKTKIKLIIWHSCAKFTQGTTLLFFLICLSRVLLMFGQLPPLQALSDFDDAMAQSLQNM